jgi:hypothetical protein
LLITVLLAFFIVNLLNHLKIQNFSCFDPLLILFKPVYPLFEHSLNIVFALQEGCLEGKCKLSSFAELRIYFETTFQLLNDGIANAEAETMTLFVHFLRLGIRCLKERLEKPRLIFFTNTNSLIDDNQGEFVDLLSVVDCVFCNYFDLASLS